MADIFVSYARQDKARVAPLVAALEAHGWSVWWDPEITPGQEFDELITAEIEAARAVVVVWSPVSVASRWVRGEARLAADRSVLVPVRFEQANLPLDARAIHTTDIDDWKENPQGTAFQELLRALRPLLKTSNRTGGAAPSSSPAARDERKGVSICVLPFVNMSNDAEQEYFSDGISEDIITDLSKVSALTVIARNSAFTFKGKPVDIKQVARQLEVSHVLEGSVRKSGKRVRITAQLIDGATNGHVWAERYDRDLDDIFALQDEISQAIVAALKVSLFPEERKAIEGHRAGNLDAYDKYLRARERFNTVVTAADFVGAADMFREALSLDPDFAEARGGLIEVLSNMLTFVPERAAETRKEMEAQAKEAQARAPDHWSAHLGIGLSLLSQRNWLAVDAAYTKLRAVVTPSSELYGTLNALFLGGTGRCAEAVETFEMARRANPLSLLAAVNLQLMLHIAGLNREAQAEYERTKDLPGNHEAQEHLALMRVWDSEDVPAIKAQFRRYLDSAIISVWAFRKLVDVVDQPAAASAILKDAFEDPANQDATRMMFIAWYAGHFGDQELALAALRRGYLEMIPPYPPGIWLPELRDVRKTQGFKQFIRDLGLYDYWRKSGKWGDFVRPIGDDDFEVFR